VSVSPQRAQTPDKPPLVRHLCFMIEFKQTRRRHRVLTHRDRGRRRPRAVAPAAPLLREAIEARDAFNRLRAEEIVTAKLVRRAAAAVEVRPPMSQKRAAVRAKRSARARFTSLLRLFRERASAAVSMSKDGQLIAVRQLGDAPHVAPDALARRGRVDVLARGARPLRPRIRRASRGARHARGARSETRIVPPENPKIRVTDPDIGVRWAPLGREANERLRCRTARTHRGQTARLPRYSLAATVRDGASARLRQVATPRGCGPLPDAPQQGRRAGSAARPATRARRSPAA
jgi:hypothetical protein